MIWSDLTIDDKLALLNMIEKAIKKVTNPNANDKTDLWLSDPRIEIIRILTELDITVHVVNIRALCSKLGLSDEMQYSMSDISDNVCATNWNIYAD